MLTGKYVISPIDGLEYCRKNGQFLRHLKANGFDGYQDFYEKQYPDNIKICDCGNKCTFVSSTMTYKNSCGSQNCTNKLISKAKQSFDEDKWKQQRDKYHQTMKNKTTEERLQSQISRKHTNLLKYGYDHPWKLPEMRKRIQETMSQKYGVSNYSSSLISPESKAFLENYNWLYNEHVVQQKPLYLIATELNVGDRTVGNYLHNHGISTHSFQRSMWERELEDFLQHHNIKYLTNCRNIISPKELDFFIPDHKLAIELCGLYWHSEAQERIDKNYHANKQTECSNCGIQLLTIFEDEWKFKKPIILSKLLYMFNKSPVIYARQTTISSTVPYIERKTFFNNYHIQGDGNGSITIALIHDNEYIAMALFKQLDTDYILDRYATSKSVVGGFSKILHHFIKTTACRSIITFADKRWSIGNLYQKTGFVVDGIIPPDYAYIKNGQRVHKFNYRHKHLRKILSNYDPTKSERENCFSHGIYRVWDCGKIRYRYII